MENFERLCQIDSDTFSFLTLDEKDMLGIFEKCDAYWVHNGDPKNPHAELTSGLCSNGFIDCLRVLKYRNLSQILAIQLAQRVRKIVGDEKIMWTIGSPMAGIYFADDLGEALEIPLRMFVEKDKDDPKKMVWNRLIIPVDHLVLQVEELVTTSQTLNEVQGAVFSGNPNQVNFVPFVAILVHRPPKLPVGHYGNRQAIALIEKEIWAVPQDECPLCEAGSKRLRPKQNWAELTGQR